MALKRAMHTPRDTIFALSSGRPPAAIAVVRISGPRARVALETLSGRLPPPRQATLARLRDPANGESLDEALALWFPSPRSETGEDMAELQLHGGRAVIAAVLAALGRLEGFRPAEAGEFTRRAFENGRLDLTAVEGLADLIGAETEAQRRQAYRQLKGLLGEQAETWRTRLIQALALVEAGIDFSDEADVPQDLLRPARVMARALRDEISAALAQAGRGERLRDGLVVAIAGPPNAGKSTLLNRIAKREAAIVSPFAGTTRDVIEVHLDLGGYPVTLLDTAGVRATDDPVEQEGVRRARARAAAADLVLWVVSADEPMADYPGAGGSVAEFAGMSAAAETEAKRSAGPMAEAGATRPVNDGGSGDASRAAAPAKTPSTRPMADPRSRASAASRASLPADAKITPATQPMAEPPVWVIRNKIDLVDLQRAGPKSAAPTRVDPNDPPGGPLPLVQRNEHIVTNECTFISISAEQGTGIESLLNRLKTHVSSFFSAESGLVTRERHRHHLQQAEAALSRALNESLGEDLVAEELRVAAHSLGRLTGKVDVEDILDVIFRDFCIGK
jgi:tRNA modification GTPase